MDNFRKYLASLKDSVSVIAVTELWCDETVNDNSLLNLKNYFSVHHTMKNKRGWRIYGYIYKKLEFK